MGISVDLEVSRRVVSIENGKGCSDCLGGTFVKGRGSGREGQVDAVLGFEQGCGGEGEDGGGVLGQIGRGVRRGLGGEESTGGDSGNEGEVI